MSADSKTEICNLALSHIGQTARQLADLDTDTGVTAIACRQHYPRGLKFILSQHHWNFAKKYQALALEGTPPATWAYSYDYPGDCIKARAIQTAVRGGAAIEFEVASNDTGTGRVIFTDEPGAVLLYTFYAQNTSIFPDMFTEALSWYLGSLLVGPLKGSIETQTACLNMYRNTLIEAMSTDGSEGEIDTVELAEWDQARLTDTE